jgi:S1-C subfamily serine protease
MEFVEPDDEPSFSRPPSVDDRLWRHPSEVGVEGGPARRLVPARTVWLVAVVAAMGASVLTSALVITLGTDDGLRTGDQAAATSSDRAITASAEPAVAIAERVRPSIVQIRAQRGGSGVSGSAVLFRNDGHLITNAHVVEGVSNIVVVLASGREVPGSLVGADTITDVAVVKADGGPFTVADLGTAADLKVGQLAVAIGSPLALAGGPSVTVGVVSALHRTVRTRAGDVPMFDMIQTDAPIAQGSSGGALVDGTGRVIGITTAIAVTDSGPDVLGFATPIDIARSVADELISTGKATHAWMGIEGSDLDGNTASDLNLEGGARLMRVLDDGPAHAAGLNPRDIVVKVDGTPIVSMNSLVVSLRAHRPGDVVAVEVVRDGQRTTRSVTLAERPTNP